MLASLALAGSCWLAAPPGAGAAETDFEEKTTVQGAPLDLSGVWLLVAQLHMAGDKYRTFPELLRISRADHAGPAIHLLDVSLPKDMDAEVKAANRERTPWWPTAKQLASLAREWPKLPRAPKEDPSTDFWRTEVLFTVAAPDRFADAFPRRDAATNGVLADSALGLQVVEHYRPIPVPPQTNVTVSQLFERTSTYGVKKASATLLEGDHVTGFIAAGPGFPIPLSFPGTFRMHCLAGCARREALPAKAPKPGTRSGRHSN